MKHMKKLASFLLAMIMVLSLGATAAAADETGSITIGNAVKGQTYTIYQILDLESYNVTSGAYAYKAANGWGDFINGTGVKGVYVNVDDQGYVTWVTGADAAAFAKLAQKYAADHEIANQGSTVAESTTVTFSNLDLGYYLVDSSLGTLCSLDTTNPNATIKEKNVEPGNEKEVQEDFTNQYGTENDAEIGQTINFQSTITAQTGAQNYVFHDKMSAGLTYGSVTGITLNGTPVDVANYSVVSTGLADGCTFEVIFTQAFCDTLKENDKIVISYTAALNENAVVGLEGNLNESKLSYGEEGKTETQPSQTKTYTWDMDILKYANGDEKKVLKDAQFVLLNNDKTKVAVIVGGKLTGWTDIPAAGTDWPENTVMTTNEAGKIEIDGLDSDTYYLREIKAPDGYNKLAGDVTITITGGDTTTQTYDTHVEKVNNQSGSELPETGGMGTTIFYVLGSILVIGAAVLLIARKRMASER